MWLRTATDEEWAQVEYINKRMRDRDRLGRKSSQKILTPESERQGALGQVIFRRWLIEKTIPHEHDFTVYAYTGPSYDFMIGGEKWEVKTQRWTGIEPQPRFIFDIFAHQIHHEPKYYVHALGNVDTHVAGVYGFITREKFLQNCIFRKKGDYVHPGLQHAYDDMFFVTLDLLTPIDELPNVLPACTRQSILDSIDNL